MLYTIQKNQRMVKNCSQYVIWSHPSIDSHTQRATEMVKQLASMTALLVLHLFEAIIAENGTRW